MTVRELIEELGKHRHYLEVPCADEVLRAVDESARTNRGLAEYEWKKANRQRLKHAEYLSRRGLILEYVI